MSLENELKKNTEAVNRLCDLMERFKPNAATEAPQPETKQEKKEAPKQEKKTEAPKEEKKETPKKPTVTLAQLQAVAKKLITAGAEPKAKAKAAIEAIAGEGEKISGLPKRDDAAEVMPKVFAELEKLASELPEEDDL